MARQADSSGDVAIIGMSCRTAGANSTKELFTSLDSSLDARVEISRFSSSGYYKKSGGKRKGLTNVKHAYFVKDDVSLFDNEFFSISPQEARAVDPQQRLLLEVSYETIENAGITLQSFRGSNTSVYTGLFTSDYLNSVLRDIDSTPTYLSTGSSNSIAANRISYFFDLHGPSMVIDTACSSTLVAFHHAVSSLKGGESDMALVCGANLILNPDMFIHMSDLGFLSPDGRCQSFDASANGYARGEGVVALLLKPLDAAIRDNDPIRAVVRGSRVNQDGRTNGLTFPSQFAQAKNMKALYRDIGIHPDEIQYFEAHATGTPAGDPVEMAAIRSVFFDERRRSEDLVVGSIKSNIGHLEACAALAGILKSVECLERQQIPPQMHFRRPNPKIDFRQIKIPTETLSWPKTFKGVSYAAVNSFGFGGTNGHVVLQRFEQDGQNQIKTRQRNYLFKFSAASDHSLLKMVSNIKEYTANSCPQLSNLSHTLLACRSTLSKTYFAVASSHEVLMEKLHEDSIIAMKPQMQPMTANGKVGFIFTGQGAQWHGMGRQMLEMSLTFSQTIARCDHALSELPDHPDWRIKDELLKDAKTSRLNVSTISQPVCTALQLGLVEIWRSWGLKPCFVVGHSSGEIAAAYAAGFISLREAIVIAYYRGKHLGVDAIADKTSVKGSMCAIGVGQDKCREIVKSHDGRLSLAAVNSPSSCTLSGDEDHIDKVIEDSKHSGVFCRKLRVDMAYHSHHMLPRAALYRNSLRESTKSLDRHNAETSCEMFSSVLERALSSADISPEYWVNNMVSPVLFSSAVSSALRSQDVCAIIEIGPHAALKGPTSDIIVSTGKEEIPYFGSCIRGQPDFDSVLQVVAEMNVLNIPMAYERVNSEEILEQDLVQLLPNSVLTDLPPYPWDHKSSFWAETRVSYNHRFREFPRHELLGARVPHDTDLDMIWRNLLSFGEASWLETLFDNGCLAMPPFAMVYMVLEAVRQIQSSTGMTEFAVSMSDVQFHQELSLAWLKVDSHTIETHLSFQRKDSPTEFSFALTARDNMQDITSTERLWMKCCTGIVSMAPLKQTLKARESSSAAVQEPDHYESMMESSETTLHPAVQNFKASPEAATASFNAGNKEDGDSYILDPSLMAWLERLGLAISQRSSVLGNHCISSIDRIEARFSDVRINAGSLSVESHRFNTSRDTLKVEIRGETDFMFMQGIQVQVQSFDRPHTTRLPLFFSPKIVPDITHVRADSHLTLDQFLEAMFQKWPMCDIGLTEATEQLCIVLADFSKRERPPFRSLHVMEPCKSIFNSPRVRVVQDFPPEQKFHLLFATEGTLSDLLKTLRPEGFVCVDTRTLTKAAPEMNGVCILGTLDGENGWVLARPQDPGPTTNGHELSRATIWTSQSVGTSPFDDYSSFDLWNPSKGKSAPDSSMTDLIVLDDGHESLLTQHSGEHLLSLLQPRVETLRNLLWVSQQSDGLPFQGAAGSFIRTLKSEYPLLNACSLIFLNSGHDRNTLAKTVVSVFETMKAGSLETEVYFKDGEISILRYHPENRLACAVGADAARNFEGSPLAGEFEIDVIVPRKVGLISKRFRSPMASSAGSFEIAVQAAVIGFSDVRKFHDPGSIPASGLGHFYAGYVQRSSQPDPAMLPGTRVIGWCQGPHSSKVLATKQELQVVSGNEELTKALLTTAASTVASCIAKDLMRLLPEDRVDINVPGILGYALAAEIEPFRLSESSKESTDFTLNYNATSGLCLNGRSITSAVQKALGKRIFTTNMMSDTSLRKDSSLFDLAHCQDAFERATDDPMGAVLLYEGAEKLKEHVTGLSISQRLFRDDGAYILIGGVGGLGRDLCRWMIQHGARHLVAISRRGADGQAGVDELQQMGAQVQVVKADACDARALGAALDKVRQSAPIFGCINLAMVLQNSPFGKMRPEQWNLAVRTKVESSRNLHQVTLRDPLDFFIMISSISSITGNRTQANYAIGNSFQNSLAAFRRKSGLPGLAIALGPVKGIGVMANDEDLQNTLHMSGIKTLNPQEFLHAMEAAVIESQHYDHTLVGTGVESFTSVNGVIQAEPDQNQLFWIGSPEFGHLLDHRLDATKEAVQQTLLQQLSRQSEKEAHHTILGAFALALGGILGYAADDIDASKPLTSYGLDSLNAVACRFWFSKQLEVDVPLFDILGSRTINELIDRALAKCINASSSGQSVSLPKPVHHRELPTHLPVSRAQRRLWFLHQFISDKTLHNLLLVCHIQGTVNATLYKETWTQFLRRHNVLTSQFINTATGLQQIPRPQPSFSLEEVNVSDATFVESLDALTNTARSHEFDLEAGELICGWLLRSEKRSAFFLASHHIAWDRNSTPTVFNETTAIYKSFVRGEDPFFKLEPPKFQYVDYAIWQQELMDQHALNPLLDYWKCQLEDCPNSISLLPFSKVSERPRVKEYDCEHVMLTLSPQQASLLKVLCGRKALTPFMFMTAVTMALTHLLTGDNDIVIGIADGDRGHAEFENLIGFAVNMLPLRLQVSTAHSFQDLLENLRAVCLKAYEHRAIPFDLLLQHLSVPRQTSQSPLFQIMVNYQNQGFFPEYDYGDFKFTEYNHYNARSQSDFSFDIEEMPTGEMCCEITFDTALYDRAGMQHFARCFETFLDGVIRCDGQLEIGKISFIPPEDRAFMNSVLRPHEPTEMQPFDVRDTIVPGTFALTVAEMPSHIALMDSKRQMTYAELDIATNRLANRLIESGVEVGDSVMVSSEPCMEMIVAVHSVLKAGAIYVPIDPTYPEDRIESMCIDANIETVVVSELDEMFQEKLISCGILSNRILDLSSASLRGGSSDPPRLSRQITRSDACCCIFTSGSTGRPKGVLIGHEQLALVTRSIHALFKTSSSDRLVLSSSLVFDASCVPIFGAIVHGATLCIASREEYYSPPLMVDLLVDSSITSCTLTPTQMRTLLHSKNHQRLRQWYSLRILLLAGEPVPPLLVKEILLLGLPHVKVFQGYGPTETTMGVTFQELGLQHCEGPYLPLGDPLYPARLHIMDWKGDEVPVGVAGELFIGGPTVNTGYLNRDDATAKSFLKDPFASVAEVETGRDRLYRTGDSCRLHFDGSIEFLGRIGGDRQVKIRGMRTELTEVESVIYDALAPSDSDEVGIISQVAVAYHQTSGSMGGVLAAYMVPTSLAPSDDKLQRSWKALVRSRIRATLPTHMMPGTIMFVPSLPQTISGKTDYKTITLWPPPNLDGLSNGELSSLPQEGLSPMEADMATVWGQVLDVNMRFSPNDEFFSVGGHSLILIHVQDAIKEKFSVTVALADMFGAPTIRGMASLTEQALGQDSRPEADDESLNSDSNVNGKANGSELYDLIDWKRETDLSSSFDRLVDSNNAVQPSTVIAITGACSMAGAHFIHHVLNNTPMAIHCLATDGANDSAAHESVIENLRHWRLLESVKASDLQRLTVHSGTLAHPTLNLSAEKLLLIEKEVHAFYLLATDVSLLKRYESLRATNIDSLRFIISLAGASTTLTKKIFYLSTWGVPHLQTWNATKLSTPTWLNSEVEMSHMEPGTDGTLGYLKVRWVCEMLLGEASRRGIPVTMFRSCMCGSSPASGTPLPKDDVNRQILDYSLRTGLVPDFGSERGGGMSWVSADFLAQSMLHLGESSEQSTLAAGKPRIYNIVSDVHVPYNKLQELLETARDGRPMRSVAPQEWFEALKATGDSSMVMEAELLERWCESGWLPFQLDAEETLETLKAQGIVPPVWNRKYLLECVIGDY